MKRENIINNPIVSVIMPVYNGDKYLKKSIDSILNQTFTDFEFIIINDGSIDKTEEIILSYSDKRIVYIKNEQNLKIVKTLNKGIKLAKGEYIARMDSDDISLPKRFEKQVDFLDKNKDVGVCGTWLKVLGTNNEWQSLVTHEAIIMQTLFGTSLSHPTVSIRKNILENLQTIYDEKFNFAEDYELWTRLTNKTRFRNIAEVLLHYRIDDTSKQRQIYKQKQINVSNNIRANFLTKCGFSYSEKELELHNSISNGNYFRIQNKKFIIETQLWLLKIMHDNNKNKFVPKSVCNNILLEKFYGIYGRGSNNIFVLIRFINELKYETFLSKIISVSKFFLSKLKQKLKLIIKKGLLKK